MHKLVVALLSVVFASACSRAIDHANENLAPSHPAFGDGGVSEFYRYSGEIPAAGVLLRQESLDPTQSVSSAAESVRLLYASTDGLNGEGATVVSGALFLPHGEAPAGGWPLLSWSHGTVGVADKCAPSWTGYADFHDEHLSRWLQEGYAIIASDYQGLGTEGTHPYLATRPEAYSNLDAIRAVQSAGFPVSDAVVLAGQSQGAGAAIATAGYASEYAPELDIRGVVATGVPYFTTNTLLAVQEARPKDVVDPMLGYNFLALTLLEQIDAEFVMEEYVSAAALPLVRGVAEICNREMRGLISDAGLAYNEAFKTPPTEPLRRAFDLMQYPTMQLSIPLFVGAGSEDRDTPLRMQSELVNAMCQAGSVAEVHIFDGFDHLTALNESQTLSIDFVAKAFRGELVSGNCDTLPF